MNRFSARPQDVADDLEAMKVVRKDLRTIVLCDENRKTLVDLLLKDLNDALSAYGRLEEREDDHEYTMKMLKKDPAFLVLRKVDPDMSDKFKSEVENGLEYPA